MAYAFELGEPVPVGVLRIMSEQLDRIAAHLAAREVHDARKRVKEIRALLRMIRVPLGEAFAIENAWYRDAARDLAPARDREAVREALVKLLAHAQPEAAANLKAARRRLSRRGRTTRRELQGRIDNLLAQLPPTRARLETWPPLEDRFATIAAGAERTLRDGRKACTIAAATLTPTAFHELRKRVKDHWYHVQLLRRLWPEMMKGESNALEALSDALGDHHDLHLLQLALAGDNAPLEAITARRAELERTAIAAAHRLFSETPAAWRKRIRGYWRASRS
ncbi:MAG TPA: CHAD domain-containing protein [Thermoanaerobaculia bacterium]|jgi:CHAD domain-containing protein|nr:CHAD domain-containing protein [Thermoanaerobaculia bacterium]